MVGSEEKVSGQEEHSGVELHYPVLLLSVDCVFTKPAKNFWSKIADELAIKLEVILAENDPERAEQYSTSGYPCLACSDSDRHYGFHYSTNEGKAILRQFRR